MSVLNYDILLDNIKRIHFIGIGGSGMCPLAEILNSEGYQLSGSDMNEGETLDRIKGYGIPVYMGHRAENIDGAELVVYSAAIKEDNPERKAAVEQGIPCIERSVMLGVVTRRYKKALLTINDRATDMCRLSLLDGKEAKSSTRAVIEKLKPNEPRENSVYLLFSNAVLPVLRPE